MSKDEAFENWLDSGFPHAMLGGDTHDRDSFNEYICGEAWRAAVKHTLEYVAEELNKRANVTAGVDWERVANVMCNLAVDIANMEP